MVNSTIEIPILPRFFHVRCYKSKTLFYFFSFTLTVWFESQNIFVNRTLTHICQYVSLKVDRDDDRELSINQLNKPSQIAKFQIGYSVIHRRKFPIYPRKLKKKVVHEKKRHCSRLKLKKSFNGLLPFHYLTEPLSTINNTFFTKVGARLY